MILVLAKHLPICKIEERGTERQSRELRERNQRNPQIKKISGSDIFMIKQEYKYSDLTGKIIGCAMKVHCALGNGFQEVIYQRALAIEMIDAGLSFSREQEMPIYYKQQQIGTRRVDFLVEEKVSVELKAINALEDVHLAQAINYLEAYDLEVGLLINFGAKSLQQKRLINKRREQKNQQNP